MTWFYRLLDRLYDRLYGRGLARAAGAMGAAIGVTEAARVLATFAPPQAVADYVHTCMAGERNLKRWNMAFTVGGCFMPTVFLYAGRLLDMGGWWLVNAETAWLLLWVWFGIPWLDITMRMQHLELLGDAFTRMVQQTPQPTQEQLNAAAAMLGVNMEFTKDDR
jgi:hypothetical protein